jgi:hypothetical protein
MGPDNQTRKYPKDGIEGCIEAKFSSCKKSIEERKE